MQWFVCFFLSISSFHLSDYNLKHFNLHSSVFQETLLVHEDLANNGGLIKLITELRKEGKDELIIF